MARSIGVTTSEAGARLYRRSVVTVALVSVLLVSVGCSDAATESMPTIKVNQVGFTPASQKLAVVPESTVDRFEIRTVDGNAVFSDEMTQSALWPFSDERVRIADFSALKAPGRYVVVVDGIGVSPSFEIRPDVHRPVAAAALKAFYFIRSRIDLEPEFAGAWARPGGHPDDQVSVHRSAESPSRPEGTLIASPGGWYDAGDYNKYIVNSAFTTATLLAAFEHFPEYYSRLEVGIPESADDVPDIIDEAVFNLRWMMTMQDPADGGVYHKLTTRSFEPMVMPIEATAQRFVVQKSTPAALDLAATAAMAARILQRWPQFDSFVADCLATAEAAWDWAQANPDIAYEQPDDIQTGTYAVDGDDFEDERFWAAVELALTTGETEYLDGVDFTDTSGGVPSWPWVSPFAWGSLAHHDELPQGLSAETVERAIVGTAEFLREQAESSAYRVALGTAPTFHEAHHPKRDFSWGSNGVAGSQIMVLLWAYRLTGDSSFVDAAVSNLDYILGRNATGYCFVIGAGTRSPRYPHHRISEADGVPDPIPGLVVGGPHDGGQDPPDCLRRFPSHLPALAYLDHVCSYATNEIAINWNAALVYAAGGIDAVIGGERARAASGRVEP